MCHKQARYSSDLSDAQWDLLRAWVPLKSSGLGRPMRLNLREVLNALLYLLKTGCQWHNLPREFPNWHSVYYHYRKWCRDGT